jgi:TRAP-type C4-dicarboxylate transport system permease small subunit
MDSASAQEAPVATNATRAVTTDAFLGVGARVMRPAALVLRVIDALADASVVMALIGELALIVANVVARAYLHRSFLWTDEVARLTLSILGFIGGAVAYRRGDHAHVRIVQNLLPDRARRFCLALADTLVVFAATLIAVASFEFIASSWGERTPILQLPAALIAMPLPVGTALLAFYALIRLARDHGAFALGFGMLIAMPCAMLFANEQIPMPSLDGDAPIVVVLAFFFIGILVGVPVGFVLLLATATYLLASGAASLVVLPQTMVNGTGNFILLAVPFFILAGLIMERGGISTRLVRVIETLVGHMRGGLLQVTVFSMYIVSGLSGSKPADVAAVGTVMRDRIRDRHGAPEGAAVLAAAAIMGETVPPSIAMLIVGSITSVSVASMFIGGLIPAAVMALCLSALIYVRSGGAAAARAPRASFAQIWRAALHAVLPLAMPGTLLAGILLGFATPTEVAAFAVLYGLFLSIRLSRDEPVFVPAHRDRHRGVERCAALHLRCRFRLFLDAHCGLPAAASSRALAIGRQQHRDFHGLLDRLVNRRRRAARGLALAERACTAAPADRGKTRIERAALRPGADHRDGRRRLHAARRHRLLCLLRNHALRRRERVACDDSVSYGRADRTVDRRLRTVAGAGPAALFRLPRLREFTRTSKGGCKWTAELS